MRPSRRGYLTMHSTAGSKLVHDGPFDAIAGGPALNSRVLGGSGVHVIGWTKSGPLPVTVTTAEPTRMHSTCSRHDDRCSTQQCTIEASLVEQRFGSVSGTRKLTGRATRTCAVGSAVTFGAAFAGALP